MRHAATAALLLSQGRVLRLANIQAPVSAMQGVRCGTRGGELQQWRWCSGSLACSDSRALAIAKRDAQTTSFVTAPRHGESWVG